MKPREYRKIMAGERELAVIVVKFKEVDGEMVERIPSFARKFMDKEGYEFIPAGPDDFLAYYERKNGKPVEVKL